MKRPLALLLLAASAALLLSGCTNITPAFAGLNTTLGRIERDASGKVTATMRFVNPNLAAYNVSKTAHRVTLDGVSIGTVNIERPFGIPPQTTIEQVAELAVDGPGASALDAALARGSASYRVDSTLTFQLFGENKEIIKSSASGTAPMGPR
ncbi:MAG TPA: hypothetical protein VEB66_04705 [Opitutaceae bacterium]|nr:hypothetical protein [Opitutaceae bacterium]